MPDTPKAAQPLLPPEVGSQASPAQKASPPLPEALLAVFRRPPHPPLGWLAAAVTESAMASGMVAMKNALAIGLRE